MKQIIESLSKKEKMITAIIVGWTFIHFIFLLISDGNKRVFWPFDDEPILVADYDKIEFFIYTLTPILIFATYLSLTKNLITDKVSTQKKYSLQKLKAYLVKNKRFFIYYSIWLCMHLFFLTISNCTWERGMYYPQLFFPFSGYPTYFYEHEKNPLTLLIYTYSYSELLIFSALPLVLKYLVDLKIKIKQNKFRDTSTEKIVDSVSKRSLHESKILHTKKVGEILIDDKNFSSHEFIQSQSEIKIKKSNNFTFNGWVIFFLIFGSISLYIGVSMFYYDSIRYVDSNPEMYYSIWLDKIAVDKHRILKYPDEYLSFKITSYALIAIGLCLLIFLSIKLFKNSKSHYLLKKTHIILITWLGILFILSIIFIGILQVEISEGDDRMKYTMEIIQPPFISTPYKNTLDVFCIEQFDKVQISDYEFNNFFLHKTNETDISFSRHNIIGTLTYDGLAKNIEITKEGLDKENSETISFLWYWKNNEKNNELGITKVIVKKNYTKSIFSMELIPVEPRMDTILLNGTIYGFRK